MSDACAAFEQRPKRVVGSAIPEHIFFYQMANSLCLSDFEYDTNICSTYSTILEAAIDKVAAEPGAVDVVRICKLAERLEFQRLRAVGEFDRSCAWAPEFVSPASALRHKTRCSHGHAMRSVRLARKLEALPEVAAAYGAGEITGEHVAEITGPYTPTPGADDRGDRVGAGRRGAGGDAVGVAGDRAGDGRRVRR